MTNQPKPSTIRKKAQSRLRRKGKRVSRSAFKTRKPHRGQVGIGEPRRWLKNQLRGY